MAVDMNELREHYDAGTLASLSHACRILVDTKLLELMIYTNKVRILETYDEEAEASLAGKILAVKQTNRVLLDFREMANQIVKEFSNEQVS